MIERKEEIKQGITLHEIKTNKFKTNLLAVFITTPITREDVTKNALISAVLRRGTQTLPSQEEISKRLEEMYGASFDCGIDKTGDNHVLKFYLEALNNQYTLKNEDILAQSMDIIFDIILDPLTENGAFKAEYVEGEKENLKQMIEAKIDNKARYAADRCVEEMYQGKPYGLFRYGYMEDLADITPKKLYEYYQKLIQTCKIDIFASGDFENSKEKVMQNKQIQQLTERKPEFITNSENTQKKDNAEEKVVTESMQITQGKLVLGLSIGDTSLEAKYVASVYNAILGSGSNSKLFQNVREKASLAYTAGSSYLKQKDNIFIKCGIEIQNYEKALTIIKEQLEDMKQGKFSEEDIQKAKTMITSSIQSIPDEQDTEISYYLGQELAGTFITLEDYAKKIEAVTKEQIIQLASTIYIAMIYFLKD